MTKCQKIFNREITSVCQSGVKSGCCVTFRQYKTVSVCFLWIGRINVHFLEIKISKELKDKLGISRGDDEVRAIWENIMRTKGVTEKQKKYIRLAEEIWG